MQPADLPGWLRRSDSRAVLLTAGLLLLAIAAQALLVFSFISLETLEEADRWLEYALRAPLGSVTDDPAGESSWESLGVLPETTPSLRVLDRDGRVVTTHGAWPTPDRMVAWVARDDTRPLWDFRLLRPKSSLVGGKPLADGGRAELALPLAHFAREAHEVGIILAVVAAVSGLAALAVAALALSRAFAPLRRATRLVEAIDARKLGQRLPSHGTGDPVDRHAEALNRVLVDVDATFDRLRAFSADVAHELRTPLNRLQNVAEVALLGGDASDLKPALERVHGAAEELARTIQSLLLLAELDDQRVELQPAEVDLDAWIASVVELYAPLFEERSATLRSRGGAGEITADRRLLDRVLSNLLDNALVYGAAGGQVEIRARREPGGVTLEVDDAGPGIPDGMHERIFDRFTRLDGARSGPGQGLGLAVARAFARLGGGELRTGDSRLGGACFVWRIPLPKSQPSEL